MRIPLQNPEYASRVISWRFICHNSETKHKTLEEIAAAFGDKVVLITENDVAAEEVVLGDKMEEMQVEQAQGRKVWVISIVKNYKPFRGYRFWP